MAVESSCREMLGSVLQRAQPASWDDERILGRDACPRVRVPRRSFRTTEARADEVKSYDPYVVGCRCVTMVLDSETRRRKTERILNQIVVRITDWNSLV